MAEEHSNQASGAQEVARRIRSARARAGITRKQLATAADASERYLATLEAGKGNPSLEKLVAIANALDIALAEVLPMGGERDHLVCQAASRLRRLSPAQLREVIGFLGSSTDGGVGKSSRIALIGLRGAGKTSLGHALADRLKLPFFEMSKEVEQLYGGSIAVLLEMNGPGALRRYEEEVLDRIVRECPSAVVAASGAIVADPPLYEKLLQTNWTIWLEASPEDHMERVISQGDLRPISGNRAAMDDLMAILAAREIDYARADARIDTSAQDFDRTLSILTDMARGMI